jgi:NAD(P)-dependent dehydrogenase (short-subunit alcohol dehydrogenase family)
MEREDREQANVPRTVVVTGSASGIGAATAARLRTRGHAVIGVDVVEGETIRGDLSTPEGRRGIADDVRALTGGRVDAVIANAGVAVEDSRTIAVNYFGVVETLGHLRPLLAASPSPRAAVVASIVAFDNPDPGLAAACLVGDEQAALALCEARPAAVYAASKEAVARWVRRTAPEPGWGGSGILLNAVGPGITVTPQSAPGRASGAGPHGPRFVLDRYAEPAEIAAVLEFLVSPDNSYLLGQILYCDGGWDAVARPDLI